MRYVGILSVVLILSACGNPQKAKFQTDCEAVFASAVTRFQPEKVIADPVAGCACMYEKALIELDDEEFNFLALVFETGAVDFDRGDDLGEQDMGKVIEARLLKISETCGFY